MKFSAILAFAALALVTADKEAVCSKLSSDACYSEDGCSWCTAGAVPSSCHSSENAARLPPAVFQCSEKVESAMMVPVELNNNGTAVEWGSCGNCGLTYQTCCIGANGADEPCECHLHTGGDGSSAKNCGTCGEAYRACCLGTGAGGFEKCNCDIN